MNHQLVACYFPAETKDECERWDRMARVLRYSAAKQCPGWDIQVTKIEAEPRLGRSDSYVSNTCKLDYWAGAVIAAEDGTTVALVDVDTMVCRPLDPVWGEPFDLAYTHRTDESFKPINAGVVFLRVSDRIKRFMARWRDENRAMLLCTKYHDQWRRRYGGINQAALGCLMETGHAKDLVLRSLPCPEWNCEDSSWSRYSPEVARVVHLKSALRGACFGMRAVRPPLRPLVRVWRQLERAAIESEAV